MCLGAFCALVGVYAFRCRRYRRSRSWRKGKTEVEIGGKRRKKRKKRRCRDCTRQLRASRWEGRFVTLAGQCLKGGSLPAQKAPVSPINFSFCVFCAFLRLFLPFSALPAIPLVAQRKDRSRNSREKAPKAQKKNVQRLHKAAQCLALGRPLCHVSRPMSKRRFPSRAKSAGFTDKFSFRFFLRFLRLFAAIPSDVGVTGDPVRSRRCQRGRNCAAFLRTS